MYQSDLQNETSKVIIKELKEMFDRIDFHVREPEAGNSHIPAWAKEEHMEQSVSEKELWSYENNKKRGDKIMKKSVLLLILTAMVITASACDGSDVTGTMTMNSSAKQEAKSTEASIAGNETSQNTTTTSSAVTELDNMLNEINTDVQPGTAGSSLKTVKVAANLLDWGTETSLSQEEIKSETVRWLSDKGNDEQAEFSQKMADVYDAYQELLGENAEELLSSAGYTGKGYPWGSSKIEAIETIKDVVQLPENREDAVAMEPTETDVTSGQDNQDGQPDAGQSSDCNYQSQTDQTDFPGPDTAMLVNLRGDTTTVYKLADGRYMDRTNTVYTFDGVDTWIDESGVEWNETVQTSEAEENVQDPYDLYSWDPETGTYIPYQQSDGNGEPIGRGNGWYYYDDEAGTYILW